MTLLITWASILLVLALFVAKMVWNARQDEKRLEAIYGNVYSAEMPTKKEIAERNTINFLLMSEEMEEQLQSINLDEHEKALA